MALMLQKFCPIDREYPVYEVIDEKNDLLLDVIRSNDGVYADELLVFGDRVLELCAPRRSGSLTTTSNADRRAMCQAQRACFSVCATFRVSRVRPASILLTHSTTAAPAPGIAHISVCVNHE